jgi:DNA modification methylase
MIKYLGIGYKQPAPLLLPAVAGPAVDRLAALVQRDYARHWNRRASLETARASAGLGYDYVWCSDVMRFLCSLPNDYVDCVVTSPPYFGLRDYGTGTWEGGNSDCQHLEARQRTRFERGFKAGDKQATSAGSDGTERLWANTCPTCGAIRIDQQIGLEPTPAEFVATMVAVFREVRRVLKPSGTCWINLGDSYSTHKAGKVDNPFATSGLAGSKTAQVARDTKVNQEQYRNSELPEKNLLMIPARVAIALQDDGWYLRSEIVWVKPSVMPESVTDRPTKSHEMVYLLTKCPDYWYDQEAIREPAQPDKRDKKGNPKYQSGNTGLQPHGGLIRCDYSEIGRNKRDVWTVPSEPFVGAHFATFPRKLIEPMILAGCPDKACGKCGKPWKRCLFAAP